MPSTYSGVEKFLKVVAGLEDIVIEEFLGAGTFGRVYRAKIRNNPAGIDYAVKIITLKVDEVPSLKEKSFIERHYKILKNCCPTCVVNIYPLLLREGTFKKSDEWGEEETFYYLVVVSDYIPQTLDKVKASPIEVLEIGIKLGECLYRFLQNGFIYTDLKPSNVGITADFHPLVLDIGGFKSPKNFLYKVKTLSQSQSSAFQFTPIYSPPELKSLFLEGNLHESISFFQRELEDGRGTTYQLSATLLEPLCGESYNPEKHRSIYDLLERIENERIKEILSKGLEVEREKRSPLREFLELLELEVIGLKSPNKFRTIQFKEIAKFEKEVISNLVIKTNQKIELVGKTFLVKNDIKIEPNGELIIKDAILMFEKKAGILGENCTFIAENSNFKASNSEWKNITIVGKIKGYIKECKFEDGRGRLGKEINDLLALNIFLEEKTYGGALFVYSSTGNYIISDCQFKNCFTSGNGGGILAVLSTVENCEFEKCSAEMEGGGVFSGSSTVEKSKFEYCTAKYGGSISALENSIIKECQFNSSFAENGGGVLAYSSTIENCSFEQCSVEKYGGGVYTWKNSTIKNCKFENCSAKEEGGGVSAAENSTIEYCKFKNCSASYGGGVVINNSVVKNCHIDNCSASHGGGIAAVENSIIEKCQFKNCSASENGGGIWCDSSTVENCEFEYCSAKNGGGVYTLKNVHMKNNIFKNCFASKGGCIFLEDKKNTYIGNIFENCQPNDVEESGCYITTATFKALKTQNDKCEELELFRWYRDNVLVKEPDGKKLVEEYYKTAPLIVEKINTQPNSEEIYKNLWKEYLKPCLEHLKRGEYQKVKTLYVEMVRKLQREFLGL